MPARQSMRRPAVADDDGRPAFTSDVEEEEGALTGLSSRLNV